jgi:multidrug resistance protein, MATE family
VAQPATAAEIRPFEVTHREVLRLSLPMMLAYLSTPLVGLVATGVIGQLGSAALIGGVSLATVVFDVIFVSCNFLRAATTGFTAQAFGAGDRAEEQNMLLGGFGIAALISVLLLALQVPIGALGLWALGASGEVLEAAQAYYAVRVWSSPFVLFNYVAFGWVLGRGEAGYGLLLQVLLNGFSVALSLLFVLRLGWGVEGAALAGVLAEAVTALAGLVLVVTRSSRRDWHIAELWNPRRLRRLLAVNSDMMIRSLALLLGLSFFTKQSVGYGTEVLAANTILMRFYFFAVAFLDGIATAAEQLAGRAVGAGFRPAFERTVDLTTWWGVGLAIIVSAAFYLSGPAVIALMTPIPEIRALANLYLPWAALVPLLGVIAFQMDGIFIGATWSRQMRNMMVLSLAIYILSWAALHPFFGNHGLWMALLIFNAARSILFHVQMRRLLPQTFPR